MKAIFSIFLFLVCLLVLTNLVSAITCASKAYGASCTKCAFDSSGKMDLECFEAEQGSGIACLFTAYPLETLSYQAGNCPAVDVCKDRLETCKAIYSNGNDQFDCSTGTISKCFRSADTCIAYAVKNCNEDPPGELENVAPDPALCDSFFFMFILPFLGAILFSKRF
ncbi:hypothetical protein KKB44_01720 [Candidatus Micrarchaeota archaeon]|nr:hypothetical protein [Candidatus Micrarchaeota archaeon]